MIPTSQEFIEAMRERVVTTSARVDVIDNEYNNGIMIENGNYAIFENNGIELDGSRCTINAEHLNAYIPYQDVSQEETQAEGWYSKDLSDANGNINTNTYTKTVKNSKKNTSNLHILFSKVREEYAVDFSVSINGNVTNYTNNTETEIVIEDVSTLSDIVIEITKWSKANSRAKILNVYLGTVFQYEDKDIVSINCKKGVNLLNEEIESKEIEIKLLDEDNTYNIFDENTELTALDNDARIIVHIGVLIGNFIYYVKIDECYFKKIEKQDNELEMIITGIGIISKYQNTKWVDTLDARTLSTQTLKQIQQKIVGNVPNLGNRIIISDQLIERGVITRLFSDKSKGIHEFINDVAINSRANVIETFDNKIYLKDIQESALVASIKLKNMENYPEIKKNESKYNVIAKKYNYTFNDAQDLYFDKFELIDNEEIKLFASDSDTLLDVSTYSFILNIYNTDGTIYESNITQNKTGITVIVYLDRIEVVATGEYAGKYADLTINIRTLEFSTFDVKKVNDSTSNDEKIIDVRTILDPIDADLVTSWISNNILKKYEYKIKINDACTYELGDTVELETGIYKNNEMITKNAIVVGIKYEYKGYLDYYLILKGA